LLLLLLLVFLLSWWWLRPLFGCSSRSLPLVNRLLMVSLSCMVERVRNLQLFMLCILLTLVWKQQVILLYCISLHTIQPFTSYYSLTFLTLIFLFFFYILDLFNDQCSRSKK
jgi:hypothetical protein